MVQLQLHGYLIDEHLVFAMGLLLDTKNLGLRMHLEYRERFPATVG